MTRVNRNGVVKVEAVIIKPGEKDFQNAFNLKISKRKNDIV